VSPAHPSARPSARRPSGPWSVVPGPWSVVPGPWSLVPVPRLASVSLAVQWACDFCLGQMAFEKKAGVDCCGFASRQQDKHQAFVLAESRSYSCETTEAALVGAALRSICFPSMTRWPQSNSPAKKMQSYIWRRSTNLSKLTWLVLGEDPAARSHRVEQFTAL
jgi:hypothetical protein